MPPAKQSKTSKGLSRALPMALACALAGLAIGLKVVFDAERHTFDDFQYILPPVAFVMGLLGWWLGVVRPGKSGWMRGLVNGVVIGLMVHVMGWFVFYLQAYVRGVASGVDFLGDNLELLGLAFAAPVLTYHSLAAYGLETLVFPALGLVFGLWRQHRS